MNQRLAIDGGPRVRDGGRARGGVPGRGAGRGRAGGGGAGGAGVGGDPRPAVTAQNARIASDSPPTADTTSTAVRTAGAGIDCHDGITRIVFAAEEHLCFALLYLMLKSRERLSQLARRGVVLSCKFKEHFNVFESARLLDCGRYYTLQP